MTEYSYHFTGPTTPAMETFMHYSWAGHKGRGLNQQSVQVGVGSGQDGDIKRIFSSAFTLFAYTHVHWLWSPTTDGSSCLIALSECESVLSLLLGEFSSAVWSWYLHWLTGVNTPTQDDIQVVAKYQGHLQMFSCGFFCVLTKSTKARARERKWERCSLSRHLGLIYTVKIIVFIRNVGLHEVCA